MQSSRRSVFVAAVLAAAVTASHAHALVVCAKEDPANPGHPKEKSKLYLKSACDPAKREVSIGLEVTGEVGTDAAVRVVGANLEVWSGLSDTYTSPNGLGNVIVGRNQNSGSLDRSGSHNVVIGDYHTYSGSGGLVAGYKNTVSADAAAALGYDNEASGYGASVLGGDANGASGLYSTVLGGGGNTASGQAACVASGSGNVASGDASSVAGGFQNVASGQLSSVGGGICNVAGAGPALSCPAYFLAGAVVSGGLNNLASANQSVVAGGRDNTASSDQSVVSGGRSNRATGTQSTVGGGYDVTSSGQDDWDAGRAPAFHTDF
jgi:hypothetical protein